MLRKLLIPLCALVGVLFCIFMIYFGSRKPPVAPILFPPPVSPYEHAIVGEGVIESAYKNINLGVSFADLITDVYVKVGDRVPAGTPLFKVDTRKLEAQLVQALQQEQVAQKEYENKRIEFSYYQRLKDKAAVSEQDYTSALYAYEIAQKTVDVAHAAVVVVQTDIERSLVVAPIDGEVLQINVRIGAFANLNPFDQVPLMVFGDTREYHIRVDVDEEDAWRVRMGEPATAFVRGNSKIAIPLKFAYVEPMIIPKRSLSGSDVERLDTRVLQVVYTFYKQDYPVYIGQLLDVYLQTIQQENGK